MSPFRFGALFQASTQDELPQIPKYDNENIFTPKMGKGKRRKTNGKEGRGGGNALLKFSFLSDFVVVVDVVEKD